MNQKQLFKIAKLEMDEWNQSTMPRGLVQAILFCFIHRATTGNTVEETFFSKASVAPDYEI